MYKIYTFGFDSLILNLFSYPLSKKNCRSFSKTQYYSYRIFIQYSRLIMNIIQNKKNFIFAY